LGVAINSGTYVIVKPNMLDALDFKLLDISIVRHPMSNKLQWIDY